MNTTLPDPGLWDLSRTEKGELGIGSVSFVEVARTYGTPLFVLNDEKLRREARTFRETARAPIRGKFRCITRSSATPSQLSSKR